MFLFSLNQSACYSFNCFVTLICLEVKPFSRQVSTSLYSSTLRQSAFNTDACNNYATRGISKEQLRNIYVMDDYGAFYCKVPKVGSTTWKRIMLVLEGVANHTRVNK